MGLRTALGLKKRRQKREEDHGPFSRRRLDDLLHSLRGTSDAVDRALRALESGTFTHPDGQSEDLGTVRIRRSEAALIAYAAMQCPTPLSVEAGFGMGSSAAIILGARTARGQAFEHLIFDPCGLRDANTGVGRGLIVQRFLTEVFPNTFKRLYEHSEIGLSRLLAERGPGCAGFVFIDGGHHFDQVMTDFFLAAKLCCIGGMILFDDAWFPAIETVINFAQVNRPDFQVHHLAADNATLMIRVAKDQRRWDHFTPFGVPQRSGWTRG